MKEACLFFLMFFSIQSEYHQFISVFPKGKYNGYGYYLTRSLNGKYYSDLLEEYPVLPDSLSFTYLCDEDSSKFFYEYDLYHMEEGYLIKHVKKNYRHHAIASFRRKAYDMVLYSKYSREDRYYYLRTFDKKGNKVDEVVISEAILDNASPYSYKTGVLAKDTFSIYSYTDIEEGEAATLENIYKSKVLTDNYKIDSFGRFDLISKDSVFLRSCFKTSKSLRMN